jgi:hypothetical protein
MSLSAARRSCHGIRATVEKDTQTHPVIALSKNAREPHTFHDTQIELDMQNASPQRERLLRAGRVLGDGLGALGDGVLGEFAGQDQPHGGLDLAG